MNVLMVAPEMAPFFKYSRLGLGENLRSFLFHLPETVLPIMPLYKGVDAPVFRRVEPLPGLDMEVCEGLFPASERRILFVRPAGGAFDPFIAGEAPVREVVRFSLGVAAYAARHPEFEAVHAHHWQCGLIPLLMLNLDRPLPTLFTFYHLERQRPLYLEDLSALDLKPELLEHVKKLSPLNLLSLGIRFGKLLSTTSRRYAEEIRTAEYGHGLDRLLVSRENRLFGIMNGVRYGQWNPAKDAHLPVRYHCADGKRPAKTNLQLTLKLPASDAPLAFYGGRLTRAYGCDLFLEALPELAEMDMQIVIFGTGDDEFMLRLDELKSEWPNVRVQLGYDEALLHRLLAGADIHLLPSREQPGGVNHLVSLHYGVVPVASRTGGYVDAIHDQSDPQHRPNGFLFGSIYAASFVQTVREALDVYAEPSLWRQYVENAMSADWSWKENARAYEGLFEKLKTEN